MNVQELQAVPSLEEGTRAIPRIPLDLRKHKASIAIHFSIIAFSSGILPVVLYFALLYGASLSPHLTFTIIFPVIGVPALYGYIVCTYRLIRHEEYRPLGYSKWWPFDYFHINFLAGIVYITVLLTLGNTEQRTNLRLLSLFKPLVVFQLSGQFIVLRLMALVGLRTPFRMSSYPMGSPIPSGAAVVAEDIVAVDGNRKSEFRTAWQARLAASPIAAATATRLDWIWGISGLVFGGAIMAIVFTLENPEIAFAISFIVPWVWGGLMAWITIKIASNATALEKQEYGRWATV
ncbi:uncharacterized protein M437DRAFT_60312 [Aureobasidium melanogenum CBS 110374]|uniref:Uncharacterized protein n=1 Tax=Aureobasidium melanogenum (strain CBS 110374) TaxID=1043003 RepID=A0A074VBL8_AURM1|nr:uncharacterized protein M437DRAFT_60312 [Aureobasidium melanogenum CBS 110374]KEQ58065.1 hypothetical protein M437DRAFT_60312 [Aureobasidium melanogenum CBS 110374]